LHLRCTLASSPARRRDDASATTHRTVVDPARGVVVALS